MCFAALPKSEFEFLFDIFAEVCNLYALLLHGVSVTDCDATVIFRVKVICYAERRSDFVFSAVSLADRSRFIKVGREIFCELIVDFNSLIAELL